MSDLAWVFEAPKASAARVFEAPSVSSAFGPMKLQNAFQAPRRSKSGDGNATSEEYTGSTATTIGRDLSDILTALMNQETDKIELIIERSVQGKSTSSRVGAVSKELPSLLNGANPNPILSDEEAKGVAKKLYEKLKDAFDYVLVKQLRSHMQAVLEAYSEKKKLLQKTMEADPDTLAKLTPRELKQACFQVKHLYNWNLVWYWTLDALKPSLNENNDVHKLILGELNDEQVKTTLQAVHTQLHQDYKKFQEEGTNETKNGVLSWSMDLVENVDKATKKLQEELSKIDKDPPMTLVERRLKLMDEIIGDVSRATPNKLVQSITPDTATLYTVIQARFDKYNDEGLPDPASPEFQSWLSAFDLVTHWNHLAAECKAEISSIGNRTSTSSSLIPAIPSISMYRKEPPNKEIIVQALRSEYERMLETLTLNDDEHMDVEEQKRHQELVDLFRTVAAFEAEVREKSNDKNFQVELGKRSELLQAFKEIDEYESADTVKRKGANNGTIEFTELYSFLKKDASNYTDYLHKVHSVLKEHLEDTKSTNWDAISNLFKDIDLNKDSIVDTCEFLRYMVLAMHSRPDLQDNLDELLPEIEHLQTLDDLTDIMEHHTQFLQELETFEVNFQANRQTMNKMDKTKLDDSSATELLNNQIKILRAMHTTTIEHAKFLIGTYAKVKEKKEGEVRSTLEVISSLLGQVITDALKPLPAKLAYIKFDADEFFDLNKQGDLEQKIQISNAKIRQTIQGFNDVHLNMVNNSEKVLEEALEEAGQVENEMANLNLTQEEVSTKIEETKKELVNLKEKVEKIVADTIESPSIVDLEKRIKQLGGIQSNLQAMPRNGTDSTEETEELKTSIEAQIAKEIKECEEKILSIIREKEEAAAVQQERKDQSIGMNYSQTSKQSAEIDSTTENLEDKITDITSQLASLTPDGLVSLVSKLEGEFTAIKEEIEREEAKAKKIRKDAEQYFSSVHKQFEAAQKSFEVNQELAKAEMETRKKIERGTDSWFGGNKETDVNPDNTVKETGDTEGAWFQGKTGTGKQEKESPLVKEPTDEPTEKPTDEPTEKPAKKPPKTKSDPLETESDLPETSQDNTIVADSLGFMEDNGFHLLSGYAEHYLSHVKRHDLENLELYECDGVYLWYANDETHTPAWNLLALMNTLLTKYNGWDCSGRCWRTSTGARRAQQLFSPWSSYGRMVQVLSGERQAHHQGVTGNFKPLELLLRAFGSTDELYSNLQDVCSFEALKHVKNPEFQEAWKTAIMPQVEGLVPKNTNTDYTELNTRIQSATCMVIGAGYNKVVAMGEEYGRLEENFPGYVGFADLPGNVTGTNVELANHPDMTLDASKPQGENAQRAINYVNGVWDAMKSYKPKGFHSAVIDRCVHNACAQEESDSTVMIWRNNCYAEHVINKLLCADRPIFFIENYSTTPFNDIIYRMTARKAFPDHRVFFGLDSVTDNIDFHEEDFLHQLDENGPSYKLDNDLRAIDAKDIPKSTYSIHCARYDGRNPVELYDQNESDLRQSKHQHRMQIDSEFEKEVIRKKEFEVFCQSYQSYVQENQRDKSDNNDITKMRKAHQELETLRTQIKNTEKKENKPSAIKLYIEYLTKQEGHFETFTGKDPKQFEYYVAIDRQGFSYAVLQAELLITDPPTADPTHKQQK